MNRFPYILIAVIIGVLANNVFLPAERLTVESLPPHSWQNIPAPPVKHVLWMFQVC